MIYKAIWHPSLVVEKKKIKCASHLCAGRYQQNIICMQDDSRSIRNINKFMIKG